jgi:hypothetical protein
MRDPFLGLKRMLFSRCCVCRGRFKYNEWAVSSFNNPGPGWFRGEFNVQHVKCHDLTTAKRAPKATP